MWKSVRANLIYLEKWQITEYWINHLNNLVFLPIQNVRQNHFHDVAEYEKISPKESVDTKEFRSKWGIRMPVIRWDVALVTALIQKLTTKKISLISTVSILVNLYREILTKFPFLNSRSIARVFVNTLGSLLKTEFNQILFSFLDKVIKHVLSFLIYWIC